MSWAAEPFFRVGLWCPLRPLGCLCCKVPGACGIHGPSFSTELLVRQLQSSSSLSSVCLIAACLRYLLAWASGAIHGGTGSVRGRAFSITTKILQAKPAPQGMRLPPKLAESAMYLSARTCRCHVRAVPPVVCLGVPSQMPCLSDGVIWGQYDLVIAPRLRYMGSNKCVPEYQHLLR